MVAKQLKTEEKLKVVNLDSRGIIKKIEISSQLDWNNLVPLAKQLLECDFDIRVFYEAQMRI